MRTLKGFFSFLSLVDNARDRVAAFGELSSHSHTYAKDKTFHTDTQAPDSTFVSFHSVTDEAPVKPDSIVVSHVVRFGQYVLDRANAGSTVGDRVAFNQMVTAEYAGVITEFEFGRLLFDGARWMPEWVGFTTDVSEMPCAVKVWLSDDAFRTQFEHFMIDVIPPIEPLDDFFNPPNQVQKTLDRYDLVAKLNQAQAARGDYPYTYLKAMRYHYVDPADRAWEIPTEWLVIIYGEAGNNPDTIKRELVKYILANSTRSEEDWKEILPELFVTTEFIFIPQWATYAVPNRELQAGIYSPTIKAPSLVTLHASQVAHRLISGRDYTPEWINQNLESSQILYKSLATYVIGNPENVDGICHFSEKFGDYMLVTNDSTDFNRMSPYTQEFVVLLSELVKAAESVTPQSSVVTGLVKQTRDGVLYVTGRYDGVTYMVASKYSVEQSGGV